MRLSSIPLAPFVVGASNFLGSVPSEQEDELSVAEVAFGRTPLALATQGLVLIRVRCRGEAVDADVATGEPITWTAAEEAVDGDGVNPSQDSVRRW